MTMMGVRGCAPEDHAPEAMRMHRVARMREENFIRGNGADVWWIELMIANIIKV